MPKNLLLKTPLLSNCPHCGVLIVRHLIYPDQKQCVYTQDKDWERINSELDTTRRLSISRKVEINES